MSNKHLENLEKKQTDNELFVLYAPDSLNFITNEMCKILLVKMIELNKFFRIDKFRKIQLNIFDDREKFRKYVLNLREDKNSLPMYAAGTYDLGMVNAFMNPKMVINSDEYMFNKYKASHELFHIMYMELVLSGDFSKRIVWFDEGMAQNKSGEYDYLNDSDEFSNFFNNVKNKTKYFPNLNDIEHGNSFCNDDYNGYELSYIAVKYLIEILSDDEIYNLLTDFDKIKEYGTHILEDAFDYYQNQLNNTKQRNI